MRLLLWVILVRLCQSKKVLFFMPVTAKSSQITWLPLAEALGDRGHNVTTICPYKSGQDHPQIQEIVLDTDFFNHFTGELSKDILSGNMTILDKIWRMSNLLDPAIHNLHETFASLKKLNFFENLTQFDVTIVAAMGGNEVGYYVAQRLNSSLVLYFQQQIALINQDFAMGQPHNPSLIPGYGMSIS